MLEPKRQMPHLPNCPGAYRMLYVKGEVLYVGKAKSLKKRTQWSTRSKCSCPSRNTS